MPFQRPTLQERVDRAMSDIESRLPGAQPRLRRTVLGAIARMHADSVHGLYGYLDWIARQLLPDTCDADSLERQARWRAGLTRKAATPAAGNVTCAGTNGATIPAGTELQRADGALYTTDADAAIAAGTATVAVTASAAGSTGNADAGTALSFSSPIAGVNSQVTVAAGGLTAGTDQESDDSLRSRLAERIQQPPHGGSKNDYVAWAKEVAGVTRAWAYAQELGLGTVTVRFVRDDDASIIPDAAEVQAAQDYIDARRPVTADVTVVAPVAVPLDFTIQLTPATQAVKDAVEAELEDLLRREAEPGGTILISHIREAISLAADETDHVLVSPAADVTHTAGQIATMGAITWS